MLPDVLPDVPEPRLPEEPEVVPPAPLVELPACFSQRSRSRPVRPTHWLGSAELPAAPVLLPVVLPGASEPMLEPVLDEPMLLPVLGEPMLLPVLEPAPPVLPPVAPADEPAEPVPAPPPACDHATLATPTNAAATAAAIVLTIW